MGSRSAENNNSGPRGGGGGTPGPGAPLGGRLAPVVILRAVPESRRTTQQTIESERLNALTLLAAGVAHEIGNPLNSLHIHLQLIERKAQELDHDAKSEL